MLEHLLTARPEDFLSFIPQDEATPAEEIDAKFNTAKIVEEFGLLPDDVVINNAQVSSAHSAFVALTTTCDIDLQKQALQKIDVPEAVKELVGMLTAYDWAFVEQAKELRGYAVAKITEETTHPDARIRLKALELLGKVTEVALFTDRVTVKKEGLSDSELDEELKRRLEEYVKLEKEVQGEIVELEAEQEPPHEPFRSAES
jgi:hypothetical protein